VAATKMNEPNQSKCFNLCHTDPSLGVSRRQMGMPTAAMTQNGVFNQKIHLQVVFSEKDPPITGPMTLPTAHCKDITENHLPLSRRVTISETTTYVNPTNPPPPTPCTHLPASKVEIPLATEAMTVPTVKSSNAVSRTDFRPIICEKDAHEGWKTVDVKRNDVPHQKAWMAVVPFKSVAMVSKVVSKTSYA
jgi:hypothetical protein